MAAETTDRIVVAAAVIERAGRVLLTKRPAGTHLAGCWEFPGGKLRRGESPQAALVRECREETGLEVGVGRIVDVTFHRYPERDVLLLFYRCEWLRREVEHLEVADHAWVTPAELDRYELPPADRPVVERIRELIAAGEW